MSIPKYPEYVNSGIDWISVVPAHWTIHRAKFLFGERNQKARAEDEQLTASQKHGVIPQSLFSKLENQKVMQVITGREILKKAMPNDFVISMRSFQGGLEFCAYEGAVSSAYVPLVARKAVCDQYFKFLFKSRPFISALQRTSNLVRDGQALRYANFAQLDLAIPELNEQTRIGKFLRHETAKIDALIREQERLIALLQKKRHGLTLSSYQTDEWKTLRLENIVIKMERPVYQKDEEEYIALGLFNRGRGLFHKEPKEKKDMGDSDFFWVESGDLILSGQFAWEGSVALAGESETGTVVSHRYPIIRGKEGLVLTEYIYAFFTTSHGDFLLNENSRGAAGRNKPLNLGSLLKENIKIPPIALQAQIAKLVYKEKEIRKETESQKNLLLEYRSALISAAVTGKIDVRDWQPPADECVFNQKVLEAEPEVTA
jgi:type I restriction enzyme S subunit